MRCDIVHERLDKWFRGIWIDPFLYKTIFLHKTYCTGLKLFSFVFFNRSPEGWWMRQQCFAAKYVRGPFLKFKMILNENECISLSNHQSLIHTDRILLFCVKSMPSSLWKGIVYSWFLYSWFQYWVPTGQSTASPAIHV